VTEAATYAGTEAEHRRVFAQMVAIHDEIRRTPEPVAKQLLIDRGNRLADQHCLCRVGAFFATPIHQQVRLTALVAVAARIVAADLAAVFTDVDLVVLNPVRCAAVLHREHDGRVHVHWHQTVAPTQAAVCAIGVVHAALEGLDDHALGQLHDGLPVEGMYDVVRHLVEMGAVLLSAGAAT